MLIHGHTLVKTLYRGTFSVAYRVAAEDGLRILRTPRDPSRRADLARLHHEHQILTTLGTDPSMQLVGPTGGAGAYLLRGDPGGEPLRSLLHGPMRVETAIFIAVGLVDALAQLHRHRIVHKDVNPDNVLVDDAGRRVSFISFALASRLPRETQRTLAPEASEGALAYISPEQTGRMNRSIDHRADFYSLGVTLYEMLTGHPPFQASDPAELVHAHIARLPVPPCEIQSGVPRLLSDLVMKLLSKNAEERYQSCHGIRIDLEDCAAQLARTGRVEGVVIGARDVPDVLHVPQKLYGREVEIERLLAAFERARQGRPELALILGYSGIGKSSLVSEIHKPVVRTQGFFIAGKHEQYKRDIPHLALTRAFQGLVRQLLTGSAESVAAWKERLVEALGAHGRLITDVIPEVEIILGVQPPVVELGPSEAQARFREIFQRFVEVFARPEHPLVLFLDDLQWADSASLKLLRLLVTGHDGGASQTPSAGSRCLLVIGAYRDNEVGEAHALSLTLEEIRKAGASVTDIWLGPLGPEHVGAIVAETLRCDEATAAPLSRLLVDKTGGNPFFLLQFLRSLHEDKLLQFDREARQWRWSGAEIARMPGTENVVELMTGKLLRLPRATQEVLELAACIGNQFDLHTLALVTGRAPARTGADLWDAVREGFVLPLVEDLDAEARALVEALQDQGPADDAAERLKLSYRFLHDRVHQAAYSLLSEGERKAVHQKLGRHLLERADETTLADRVFDIVNHFSLCQDLLVSREERRKVAELNLLAADRAKDSTAYELAREHAVAGAELLPEGAWELDYDLVMALTTRQAECEYLTGHFAEAKRLFDVILGRARTVLEKIRIHTLTTVLHRHNARYEDAIAVLIAGLALADVVVPAPTDTAGLLALLGSAQAELAERMRGREIATLIDLPRMTDPRSLAIMSLLEELSVLGMFLTPLLVNIAALRMINLSLEHGNAAAYASAYAVHGMILGAGAGDFASGYAFGRLAMDLSQRQGDPSAQCKCGWWFGGFISHFKNHLSTTLSVLKEACELGLRTGDQVMVCYSAFFHQVTAWARGEPLDEVCVDPMWSLVKEPQSQTALVGYRQAARSLMGATPVFGDLDDAGLVGGGFVDADHVALMKKSGLVLSLQHYRMAKAEALYYAGRYAEALAAIDEARAEGDVEVVLFSQVGATESVYWEGMIAAARHDEAPVEERAALAARVIRSREKLDRWALHCPPNFRHKELLLSAELARVEGRELDAMTFYDQAKESARAGGFTHQEALAAELAGRLHLQKGRSSLAAFYLKEARGAYARWGALAKVRALEARYPEIGLSEGVISADASIDIVTVMKASHAISGEIVLERLLATMMSIILENAGATRGYFILERGGRLLIEAAGATDGTISALGSVAVDERADLCSGVVNYVARTGQQVVVDDAVSDARYGADPYVARARPRSILATPILSKQKRVGILYLENNLLPSAFTAARLRTLEMLATQAAISIENALLFDTLEQRVQERTRELVETRNQLVVQEKLASLGALTAGIAHEIKNPLNFVNNFAEISGELCRELADEIEASVPLVGADVARHLGELTADLRENLARVNQHGRRADGIVRAMLEHSHAGTGTTEWVDLNALVADNANLSLHGLRSRDPAYVVQLEAEYDASLTGAEIVPQDIGRVVLNLVNNAWYATRQRWLAEKERFTPIITLRTRKVGDAVEIRVRDNGAGIAEAIRDKIFNPFFTTKPAPDGVGLGLSISHDIVTQRNGGTIRFESSPGQYTEFVVVLPAAGAGAPPEA
jgi:predicted ATPase/signal transduction histidine kinase